MVVPVITIKKKINGVVNSVVLFLKLYLSEIAHFPFLELSL